MSDLIDRQAAINAVLDLDSFYNVFSDTFYKWCIVGLLNDIPAVDAEPVMHGQWEYVKKRLARGGYVDASECSVCHKRIMPHLKPNYCPNCGAKMDVERRTDDDKRAKY